MSLTAEKSATDSSTATSSPTTTDTSLPAHPGAATARQARKNQGAALPIGPKVVSLIVLAYCAFSAIANAMSLVTAGPLSEQITDQGGQITPGDIIAMSAPSLIACLAMVFVTITVLRNGLLPAKANLIVLLTGAAGVLAVLSFVLRLALGLGFAINSIITIVLIIVFAIITQPLWGSVTFLKKPALTR